MMLTLRNFHTKGPFACRSLSSYKIIGDSWKLASYEALKIGSRTLIVSESDELSKESSGRMGFEMQRKNIQPVFCTMGTAYPTNKNIEDSVDMFRRTGCKSIIAVGSGALIDTAKTIRLMAETNVRKISDIAKPLHFRDHVPLLSVATTISPVHSLASGGVLHFEDDVLVRTRCHQPEVLVYDTELIEKSTYYIREASTAYLLSQLFDCLFSVCLVGLEQNKASGGDINSPEPTSQLLSNIITTLAATPNERSVPSNTEKDLSYSRQMTNTAPNLTTWLRGEVPTGNSDWSTTSSLLDLSSVFITLPEDSDEKTIKSFNTGITSTQLQVAESIGILRSHIHSSCVDLRCSRWPGVLETCALLVVLNVESGLSLPYTWAAAAAFGDLVNILEKDRTNGDNGKSRYNRPMDLTVLSALHNAYSALLITTNLTSDQVQALCKSSSTLVSERIKKTPKKFRRSIPKGGALSDASYQEVSPAGHLEKLIAIEDMSREAETAERHIAQGGSAKNINEVVTQVGASLRMGVLKSDVMLDLVEKVMRV